MVEGGRGDTELAVDAAVGDAPDSDIVANADCIALFGNWSKLTELLGPPVSVTPLSSTPTGNMAGERADCNGD